MRGPRGRNVRKGRRKTAETGIPQVMSHLECLTTHDRASEVFDNRSFWHGGIVLGREAGSTELEEGVSLVVPSSPEELSPLIPRAFRLLRM